MKNILITGGGGFLGKAVVRQLLQKGHRVISFSRKAHPELKKMGVHQIQGDITDLSAVGQAAENIDVIFHTAAKAGVWGDFEEYFNINVTGTRNIVSACRSCRVSLLIHTSSPSVVFDGRNMEGVDESVPYPTHYHTPYPETKAMAEKEVVAASKNGLKTVILRPHLIWGPEDPHLVPRIIARSRSLRRVGDGCNTVDTIYVDNAAHAHVRAMEALEKKPSISGRIYFISDDAPIALWTMIDKILAAGGKTPVKRSISPGTAYRIGAVLEWIHRTFKLSNEPKMTRFVAKELATSHWFDITAAKRDLEYTADISMDEGFIRLKTWLSEKGFQSEES